MEYYKNLSLENIVEEINGVVYTEQWKDLKDAGYQVSNFGRIKSVFRVVQRGLFTSAIKEKIRKQTINRSGYPIVSYYVNGTPKTIVVHLCVWDYFGTAQRDGRILTVDHINEIKSNCSIWNLQLLTNRDNKIKGVKKDGKLTGAYLIGTKYWYSKIRIGNKIKSLGSFKTQIEAHNAYLNAKP